MDVFLVLLIIPLKNLLIKGIRKVRVRLIRQGLILYDANVLHQYTRHLKIIPITAGT